ncbi:MAG: glycoside hydrolase [Vicinamibacterales bacterium]
MTAPLVRVALLWHMHQPYYLDPWTGESILPWVRLHALKDYWGMVTTVTAVPGMRATFNLVPSLVEQVEAYAAERTWDRHLVVGLTDAAAVADDDAAWFIREAFHAHAPTMVQPYPRYAELAARAARGATFSVADLRDLQVWQKLAWVDPEVMAADPRARRLVGKSRDFDEADKGELRALELDLLRRIIPAYREAAAQGAVELSTSPYFHPILPLLCDSAAHLAAHPTAPLPDPPFRRPDDAAEQLRRAVAAHRRWFGAVPSGVWPSEGSISDAAAAEIARAGFRWAATDEEILVRSASDEPLTPGARCRPHRLETSAGPLHVLFRDHALSDLIGFTYQGWATEAAVGDFLTRVREAGQRAVRDGVAHPVVPVILDGENAWEHYSGGGRPFLRALYRALVEAADLRPVTMQEASGLPPRQLRSIFAGSWINADFGIWIGHRDDRRAWELLGQARARIDARPDVTAEARTAALDAALAAEGSDWCWWYGDDHSSAHDREFDALYRRHLSRVYVALGEAVPDALHRSVITTRREPDEHVHPGPVDGTGDPRSYFATSGAVGLERASGTMHRMSRGPIRDARIGLTADGLAVSADVDADVPLSLVLELRRTPLETPSTWPLANGAVRVTWAELRVNVRETVHLRLVARDGAGHIVQSVPGDGTDRVLDVPAGTVNGHRWRA